MKKELLELINSLDPVEFENLYRNNPNKVVVDYYGIKDYDLPKILDVLNIRYKTKEEVSALIKKCFANKSQEEKDKSTKQRLETRSNWSEEYRKELSEKQSFIRKNFTEEQKQHQLAAFKKTIANKPLEQELERRKKLSEATRNQFARMTEDERIAFSKKMSDVYSNLSDEVKESRKKKISYSFKKSCQKKYGVDNILQLEEIKEKIKKTNLEKYGVEYACQLPQCKLAGNDSSINLNFKQLLIENNLFNDDRENREFNLNPYTYDFKINNNLIELNPTVTHNSTWSPFPNQEKDKQYHYNKSKLARDNGYRCICIWDWDDVNKIINLLLSRETIYARKCEIREVDLNITREYLNQYHLQGFVRSKINIGLFYNNELVSIMTFDKPRYNKNYEYELIRYCSSYNVIGGAEKLFKYFIRNYNPKSIISYCDWSKFNGDVYTKLGFSFRNYSIGKHWYNMNTGKHITDNLLRQRGFDQLFGTDYGKGTSNEELMLENGFVEIYDCGQAVFEYLNIV